jgi:ribosome-associated protein
VTPGDDAGVWISRTQRIPEHEIEVQRAHAGGPGGQHVNKTATKIVLRYRPASSSALTAEQRERVLIALERRLTVDGDVVIHSSEHRSAERNLEAARARLAALLRQALERPKSRRPTRPTRGSRARRLETKRRRGERKRERRAPGAD